MYMIDLPLDAARLMRYAWDQGHGRAADDDFGYAAHAWLAATLGEKGPKPFRLLESRRGLRLLGYSASSIDELAEHVRSFAEPRAMNVCDWTIAASKAMPSSWQTGRRLGFEVRACPVSRGERERDVFLVAVSRADAAGTEPPPRHDVYAEWLAQQVTTSGAAEISPAAVRLIGFRRIQSQRLSRMNGGVRHRSVERPDALFSGELAIRDPDLFARLLNRGIGRHRAFGFGMLLLRPPSGSG
jgi:CRISPR system Cascade subunit CasE